MRVEEAFSIQTVDSKAEIEKKESQLGRSVRVNVSGINGNIGISVLKQDVPQAIDLLHHVLF